MQKVELYGASETVLTEVVRRAAAAGVALRSRIVNRTTLARYIRTANHSFLFIDYDFWQEDPNVYVVEPPPCISDESICRQELDTDIAIRVADVNMLQSYEPNLIQFVYDFKPSPESMRVILELEGNGTNIEEAACAWAVKHKSSLKKKYDVSPYSVFVYYCDGDPDSAEYDNLINIVSLHAHRQMKKSNLEISVYKEYIDCSDPYNLSSAMYQQSQYMERHRVVAVIAAGGVGAADAMAQASHLRLPLLLTDAAPASPSAAPPAAWRVLGRPRHLARALQRFVRDSGWTRLAVLSQPTPLATELYAEISDGAPFAHHNYQIPLRPSKTEAKDYLRSLLMKARIIFVNADPEAAAVIMTAAIELEMSFAQGYVWILREWPVAAAKTTVLTVSFWARGEQGLPFEARQSPLLKKLSSKWTGRRWWPPRALGLADALLTLYAGLSRMLRAHPNTRRDLHSDHTMTLVLEQVHAMLAINR